MHSSYQVISSAFCVIVVLSNIISAKFVQLPLCNFCVPAGLIVYPLTFLLSDFVTEIYGTKRAKHMVYMAFGMCLLSFVMIQMALVLPSPRSINQDFFRATLGLSGLRISSSLIAYLTSQLFDIQLYAWLKLLTGKRWIWFRTNASTLFSQLLDTAILDISYLYWGLNMELKEVLPIMLFSYAYKSFFSILTTPFLYLLLFLNKKWHSFKSSFQFSKWSKNLQD
jgi:queuosine precursor transporter